MYRSIMKKDKYSRERLRVILMQKYPRLSSDDIQEMIERLEEYMQTIISIEERKQNGLSDFDK